MSQFYYDASHSTLYLSQDKYDELTTISDDHPDPYKTTESRKAWNQALASVIGEGAARMLSGIPRITITTFSKTKEVA